MLRKTLFAILLVAVVSVPVSAQTVDELIAKHIQARGGMEKIKAIKTLRVTGRMTVGPGIEAPVVLEEKRPNSMRLELSIQGLTAVQAYNGKTGWAIMPFAGKKDPEPMGEDDLKATSEQADFDGPLIDYKDKGNKVELVGKEPVEGTDAYKLKVLLKDGNTRYIYLDTDSFLVIKEESKVTIRGTEREGESSMGDYKEVDGVMFPFSVESGLKGSAQKQKITIDKMETNVPIDDSRFQMPEVKKEEPKPEEKKQ